MNWKIEEEPGIEGDIFLYALAVKTDDDTEESESGKDGDIAGEAYFTEEDGIIYIKDIRVEPEYRRRNVGIAMMNHIKSYAEARNIPGITVHMEIQEEDEFTARMFLARTGFFTPEINYSGMKYKVCGIENSLVANMDLSDHFFEGIRNIQPEEIPDLMMNMGEEISESYKIGPGDSFFSEPSLVYEKGERDAFIIWGREGNDAVVYALYSNSKDTRNLMAVIVRSAKIFLENKKGIENVIIRTINPRADQLMHALMKGAEGQRLMLIDTYGRF